MSQSILNVDIYVFKVFKSLRNNEFLDEFQLIIYLRTIRTVYECSNWFHKISLISFFIAIDSWNYSFFASNTSFSILTPLAINFISISISTSINNCFYSNSSNLLRLTS